MATTTRLPNSCLAGQALTVTLPVVPTDNMLESTVSVNTATTSSLGVVQVGTGLAITGAGVLSATGGGGATTGTWIPVLTSTLGATFTLSTATATYVKVGVLVTCVFDFTIFTEVGGGNAGLIAVTGLPFTSAVGVGDQGSLVVTYFNLLQSDNTYITGTVAGSSTTVLLWTVHQAKLMTRLQQDDIQPLSRLVGTITYISAT